MTAQELKFRFNAEHIYTICVVLAFGLLFYANADQLEAPDGTVVQLGIGKSFYLPCGIALICSFLMNTKKDTITSRLNWMVGLALISTILNMPATSNILEWTATRYIFAILCFRGIRLTNPNLLVYYSTIAAPFIIFPHYYLTDPFEYHTYRYGGFYGDPNFLAIALNLLITLCYLSFKIKTPRIIRCSAVVSILGAIPLILLGVSRGGILGLSIVLFFIMSDIYKSSKRIFLLLLITGVTFSGPVFVRMTDTFDFIEARFSNESQSDAGGAKARVEGIESCINVLTNQPHLIPFGIGPGQTIPKKSEYRQYGYIGRYGIHNTFFSLLYEFGIISFIMYLLLYWSAFKHLKSINCYLLIGLLISDMLSLFTLPGVSFMPAWILLFFLLNTRLSSLFTTNQKSI